MLCSRSQNMQRLLGIVLLTGALLFVMSLYGTTLLFHTTGTSRQLSFLGLGALSLSRLVLQSLPEHFDEYCENIFESDEYKGYNFTKEYSTGLPKLKAEIKRIGDASWEGSSGSLREQTLMLHFLAQGPQVKTVCETGFNVGYSAFAYLTANPKVTVHSFDIGRQKGTEPMVKYLKSLYGNRLYVHFGDSTNTLPKFHQENPEVKCDVILVDGGHSGMVPWMDIQNFASMFAVTGKTVMMLDDYPTRWGILGQPDHGEMADSGVMADAWQLAVHYKLVKEIMRCTFKRVLYQKWERGFVIGLVTSDRDFRIR